MFNIEIYPEVCSLRQINIRCEYDTSINGPTCEMMKISIFESKCPEINEPTSVICASNFMLPYDSVEVLLNNPNKFAILNKNNEDEDISLLSFLILKRKINAIKYKDKEESKWKHQILK
jgi:hypothetical protein